MRVMSLLSNEARVALPVSVKNYFKYPMFRRSVTSYRKAIFSHIVCLWSQWKLIPSGGIFLAGRIS